MRISEVITEEVPWDDMYDKTAGGKRSMKNPMPNVDSDDPIFAEVHDWADGMPNNAFKPEDVPVSKIIGTESYVDPNNVKQPRNSEPAVFMHYDDDKYYVRDGNHRVVNAFLRGDKTVKGLVVTKPQGKRPFKIIYDIQGKGQGSTEIVGTGIDDIWPRVQELEQADGGIYMVDKILDTDGTDLYT